MLLPAPRIWLYDLGCFLVAEGSVAQICEPKDHSEAQGRPLGPCGHSQRTRGPWFEWTDSRPIRPGTRSRDSWQGDDLVISACVGLRLVGHRLAETLPERYRGRLLARFGWEKPKTQSEWGPLLQRNHRRRCVEYRLVVVG